MLRKKLLIVIMLLTSSSCFATIPSNKSMQISSLIQAEQNKTAAHSNQQTLATKQKVYEIFRWFNTLSNTNNSFTRNEISKYFASNVKIYKNNKLIGSGREQIYNALKLFQQHIKAHKLKKVHVILPFKKMAIDSSGNRVILNYSIVKEYDEGRSEIIPGHTLLQLKDHKVQQWHQTYTKHKKQAKSE